MESRIKEYKKITINDYRNYEPEKCSDGGAYGFWTEYLYKGGDIWNFVLAVVASIVIMTMKMKNTLAVTSIP